MGFSAIVLGLLGLTYLGARVAKDTLEPEVHYDNPRANCKRNQYGQIIIDDEYRYRQDVDRIGSYAAFQKAERGEYNMPNGQYTLWHDPTVRYKDDK